MTVMLQDSLFAASVRTTKSRPTNKNSSKNKSKNKKTSSSVKDSAGVPSKGIQATVAKNSKASQQKQTATQQAITVPVSSSGSLNLSSQSGVQVVRSPLHKQQSGNVSPSSVAPRQSVTVSGVPIPTTLVQIKLAPVSVSSQPFALPKQSVAVSGVPIVTTPVQKSAATASQNFWASSRQTASNILSKGKAMLAKPKSGKNTSGVPIKVKKVKTKSSMSKKLNEAQFNAATGVSMITGIQWSKAAKAGKRAVGKRISRFVTEADFALNAGKRQFNKRLGTKFKVHESRNAAVTRLAIQRTGNKLNTTKELIKNEKELIEASKKKLKTETSDFSKEYLTKEIAHKEQYVKLREAEIVALGVQRANFMGTKFNAEGYKHDLAAAA